MIEIFKLLSQDYYQQQVDRDPWLCPGNMGHELIQNLPMTAIFTGEFDYCRRDAMLFADKLKAADKLLGV